MVMILRTQNQLQRRMTALSFAMRPNFQGLDPPSRIRRHVALNQLKANKQALVVIGNLDVQGTPPRGDTAWQIS